MLTIVNAQSAMRIGILAMGGIAPNATEALRRERAAVEAELRARFGETQRAALKAVAPMDAYVAYYRKFGYTYHVLLQLEGVARGKPVPDALPAVAAMFLAELRGMLLTAGHDLDKVAGPVTIAAATGAETYEALGGRMATAVPGDILIRDEVAPLSSILRGPDARTAITEGTRRVLYTVYAPPGVAEKLLDAHLRAMEGYVKAFCEGARTELLQIY